MGMRKSWLWVKLPRNQWKKRVHRDPAMPGFWRGYSKKVVFSLLPSEYRTRAPSVSAPNFSLVILVVTDLCLQILVNTTSMCIWVLSLKMIAFCFLDVWKSWGRCFSWQQIKQSESSESHSPNRWKKVVAAVFLEGVRWRHKLLNTRGPSVSLRALVTKLNSEALVKQMYATMQANACDMTSRCIPHCNWMNATLPNYTYYNANSWFQHCKR